DERAGMQLDADQQLRVLPPCEPGELSPVRQAGLLPLALVVALEVRQPPAGGESRTHVARAAGEPEHAIDAELGGEQDRLAELHVVAARELTVRVGGVAPRVQRSDAESALLDACPPALAPRRVGQEQPPVAMRRRGVAAASELEVGNG